MGLVLANSRFPIPQIFNTLEKLFVRFSDGIVLSQGNLAACAVHFGEKIVKEKPVVQVLNVPPIENPPESFRMPKGSPLRVLVSGYISPPRGARLIIDNFRNRDDIYFDVVGDIRYSDIEKSFREMSNARVHGLISYEDSLRRFDEADLIWLHYDPSLKNVAIASSNKMFEGMMFAKPYVTADGCWMADMANKYNIGWSVPYGDVNSLTELWSRLNRNPKELEAAGMAARECYLRFFRWQDQRDNLLRMYREVMGFSQPVQIAKGWDKFIGQKPF